MKFYDSGEKNYKEFSLTNYKNFKEKSNKLK